MLFCESAPCWCRSGSGSDLYFDADLDPDPQHCLSSHYYYTCPLFQCFGSVFISSGSGSRTVGWIPIRIQGFDDYGTQEQLKKNLNVFKIKNCNLPVPRPPSYRRSLQPSKENIQHLKTWNFSYFIFYLCSQRSGFGYGYGSSGLIESGFNPDLDPKHCVVQFILFSDRVLIITLLVLSNSDFIFFSRP